MTPPPEASTKATTNLPYTQTNSINKIKNSITTQKKSKRFPEFSNKRSTATSGAMAITTNNQQKQSTQIAASALTEDVCYCEDIDAGMVNDLSLRLLAELRAAKQKHLSCTEVSIPCDLTTRIAAEIIRLSDKEPCGLRGCTIYIEFEDEPHNSRRIATLKINPEAISTFEIYLTLRQDHRGWTALLPQFMKQLSRTITISPEFTISKNKLYSPSFTSSTYSYTASKAISTPTA